MAKPSRQPIFAGNILGSRMNKEAAAFPAAPHPEAAVHDEVHTPAILRGNQLVDGGVTAAYSPPIPSPVRSRKSAKLQKFHATALRSTPAVESCRTPYSVMLGVCLYGHAPARSVLLYLRLNCWSAQR